MQDGYMAAHLAAQNGHVPVLQFLAKQEADFNMKTMVTTILSLLFLSLSAFSPLSLHPLLSWELARRLHALLLLRSSMQFLTLFCLPLSPCHLFTF